MRPPSKTQLEVLRLLARRADETATGYLIRTSVTGANTSTLRVLVDRGLITKPQAAWRARTYTLTVAGRKAIATESDGDDTAGTLDHNRRVC